MEIVSLCSAEFDGVPSIADTKHGNHLLQKLSFPMKLFIRICLSLCAAAMFASPAGAQYWNPWSGWWGAGYYGTPAYSAPVYTSYYGSPSYTSFYGSSNYGSPSSGCCGTGAPAYAVGYGSCGSGCCATSCCDSCGSGCSSGSCASGSCGGITPAGSLKPAQDPNFQKKATDYDDEPRPRRFNPDGTTPATQGADDPLDPVDSGDRKDMFGRPKAGTDGGTGFGSGSDTFEADPVQDGSALKPPMTDPLDGKPLDPVDSDPGTSVDEKTFFDGTTKPDTSVDRGRDAVIARTSSLSEVIAPKRLASRTFLASKRSVSGSKLADKSQNTKSDSQRPLRWISAPLADGHVQL